MRHVRLIAVPAILMLAACSDLPGEGDLSYIAAEYWDGPVQVAPSTLDVQTTPPVAVVAPVAPVAPAGPTVVVPTVPATPPIAPAVPGAPAVPVAADTAAVAPAIVPAPTR